MSKTHSVCLVFLAIVLFSGSSIVKADDAIKKKILELYPQADANKDGVISDAEEAVVSRQALKRHPEADKDGDGILSDAEKQALLRMAANRRTPQRPQKSTRLAHSSCEPGIALKEKTDALDLEAHLIYPGAKPKYKSQVEFFVDKLLKH